MVDFQHDLFSLANRIRYGAYGGRNVLPTIVLRKLSCCENARCNQQNACGPRPQSPFSIIRFIFAHVQLHQFIAYAVTVDDRTALILMQRATEHEELET
jgi:hypothetical protein